MRKISMKGKKSNDIENVNSDENEETENNSEANNSTESADADVDEEPETKVSTKSKVVDKTTHKKSRKKSSSANGRSRQKVDPLDVEEADEPEYEVEKVVGKKKIKNVVYYQIRWKGYGEDDDTWEEEGTLSCPELILEYEENESSAKSTKNNKNDKKAHKRGKKTSAIKSKKIKRAESEDDDDEKEYEVDRIVEVHHLKNGKREFLIRWKGYPLADASWEPEEHLNCKELIDKFMAKLDDVKQVDQRELRPIRVPTKRFTLSMGGQGRRLSRRHGGRQRMSYHDSE